MAVGDGDGGCATAPTGRVRAGLEGAGTLARFLVDAAAASERKRRVDRLSGAREAKKARRLQPPKDITGAAVLPGVAPGVTSGSAAAVRYCPVKRNGDVVSVGVDGTPVKRLKRNLWEVASRKAYVMAAVPVYQRAKDRGLKKPTNKELAALRAPFDGLGADVALRWWKKRDELLTVTARPPTVKDVWGGGKGTGTAVLRSGQYPIIGNLPVPKGKAAQYWHHVVEEQVVKRIIAVRDAGHCVSLSSVSEIAHHVVMELLRQLKRRALRREQAVDRQQQVLAVADANAASRPAAAIEDPADGEAEKDATELQQ